MDTATYKDALETQKTTLIAELKTLGIHDPSNDANWIATPEGVAIGKADPNVVADQVEGWTEDRGTMAELKTRFNNINRALAKIEAGTYGICEISGTQIETDRLTVNPAARTCKAHLDEEASLPL